MSSSTADHLLLTISRPATWVLQHLRSTSSQGVAESIRMQNRSYERALTIVRAFYALSLVWTIQEMGAWPVLRDVDVIDPQWTAGWVDRTDPGGGISAILLLFGVASVLAALWPTSRTYRALYTLGLLQYLSVKFGFGKVNHNLHSWLWVSAILILLPSGRKMRDPAPRDRHSLLAVLWSAQIVVLFFYTLTGLWKVAYALHALTTERVSSFQLEGFSLIIGERLLATDQSTLMGEFFVRNQFYGWLLFNGTMYLESAALLAAFRPRLHRLWGGGLIAFHLGTQLAMGFTFIENIALLALLFMCSPWAPERASIREVFLDLPGVHFVTKRLASRRGRVVVPEPAPAASPASA